MLTSRSDRLMHLRMTVRRPEADLEKIYPVDLDPYDVWKAGGLLYKLRLRGWSLQPGDVIILHRKNFSDKTATAVVSE